MRTHVWGPTGWQVPVLGQGTWYLDQADREEAIRALRRAAGAGDDPHGERGEELGPH